MDTWLELQFKNKVKKDNRASVFYRKEGNKCYARKELLKSLEYYTKSICSATPCGREYGLAVANRSAVSFEMREYEVHKAWIADLPVYLKFASAFLYNFKEIQ